MNHDSILDAIIEDIESNVWFDYTLDQTFIFNILKKHKHFSRYREGKMIYALKKIFDELVKWLKLERKFIKFELTNYSPYVSGPVGMFFKNSQMGCNIEIKLHSSFSLENYICIMVHELLHYFTDCHDIKFEYDEELTNDILMVYMGMGNLMIKGYSDFLANSKNSFDQKRIKIGYIDVYSIRYCMNAFKKEPIVQESKEDNFDNCWWHD